MSLPERIGRFRITGLIADGGMGQVLRGVSGEGEAAQRVAIKRILQTHIGSAEMVEQLRHEARLTELLKHPNIAEVLETGETDDGGVYIAMEFVEGVPLSKLLGSGADRTTLPVAEIAHICAEVCAGLEYAHALKTDGAKLKLVHRDLSPHNILISTLGEVKIIDFGVAKAEALVGPKTATGILKGKLAYMSPEQALDRGLDGRSDLFSLGLVLFEGLAGRRLYRERNQVRALMAAQQAAVARELSELRNLDSRVFETLRTSLRKSLAARFHDAAQMRKALLREVDDPGRVREALAARAVSALRQAAHRAAAPEAHAKTAAVATGPSFSRAPVAGVPQSPRARAALLQDQLAHIALLPGGADVLKAVRHTLAPETLLSIDGARASHWVPLRHAVEIADAIQAHAGEAGLSAWASRSFLASIEGPLLAPIFGPALSLGVKEPDRVMRAVPRTFPLLYQNAGALRKQALGAQALELRWEECPLIGLADAAWHRATCAGYEALLERAEVDGTVSVEVERAARCVRFAVSWTPRPT